MIKAKAADRTLVIDLLAGSFDENQSVNYIVRQDRKRAERIRSLMAYSFDVCYHFGEVWLSGDKKASVLVLYPHLKKHTVKSLWLDVKLIFKAIGPGRIRVALQREAAIKERQFPGEMAYLWFIGVSPLSQNRGIGSGLLEEVLQYAGEKHLPVCLETSTLKNIPWYERFGFSIYNKLNLGYTLYFLKRDLEK